MLFSPNMNVVQSSIRNSPESIRARNCFIRAHPPPYFIPSSVLLRTTVHSTPTEQGEHAQPRKTPPEWAKPFGFAHSARALFALVGVVWPVHRPFDFAPISSGGLFLTALSLSRADSGTAQIVTFFPVFVSLINICHRWADRLNRLGRR